MDTSELYIKMCDCPKIQDKWEQSQAGDFYFMRDSLFCPTKITGNYNGDGWKLLPRTANYGWLPRQDQIQEMLIKEKFGTFDANWDICIEIPIQFVAKNPILELSSMEQIWLSCYMLSIHHKLWDGEKWLVG